MSVLDCGPVDKERHQGLVEGDINSAVEGSGGHRARDHTGSSTSARRESPTGRTAIEGAARRRRAAGGELIRRVCAGPGPGPCRFYCGGPVSLSNGEPRASPIEEAGHARAEFRGARWRSRRPPFGAGDACGADCGGGGRDGLDIWASDEIPDRAEGVRAGTSQAAPRSTASRWV